MCKVLHHLLIFGQVVSQSVAMTSPNRRVTLMRELISDKLRFWYLEVRICVTQVLGVNVCPSFRMDADPSTRATKAHTIPGFVLW